MQNYDHAYAAIRGNFLRTLHDRGYLRRVARAGNELSRWRDYLERLGQSSGPLDPLAQPTIFPMMTGLQSNPWRDAQQFAASAELERCTELFRSELTAVDLSRYIQYPSDSLAGGRWTVLPIFVFGEATGELLYTRNPFPETTRILLSLPDACPTLPLADTIFSAHAPGTHLAAHCSWDPFRLRLHLGITVPERCNIRVGSETRSWQVGKVLAFHDAYEHETWNLSDQPRVVLIVDLWHPGLSMAERRAILACFRKREVRSELMRTRAPPMLQPIFERQFAAAEAHDPLIAEFWDK